MTHKLKCWPESFQALFTGAKTFELRWNDRNFKVDDTLQIREYDPESDTFTGRSTKRVITYILPLNTMLAGTIKWVILSIR